MENSISTNDLNLVLKKTIDAIEESKKEIFDIAEKARNEHTDIELELGKIQASIEFVIKDVDKLEIKEKVSRQKLLEVSKNLRDFSEKDIKKAYDTAKDLQIELTLKRHEERDLIKARTALELRLRDSKVVIKKAENLTSKVGLALGYLSGEVFKKVEDIQTKSNLGIKIIKAQEDERQRVSREIHDGPAQAMANLILKADYCEKMIDVDKDQAKQELYLLKELVRDNLKNIRKIIYDLMPMSLDDLGLMPTVQRLVTDFEKNSGIKTKFICVDDKETVFPKLISLTVFRIIQEGLNNIMKHSKATNAVIETVVTQRSIDLGIYDNGNGFDMNEINIGDDIDRGFGLYSMKERVDLLDGSFELTSNVDKGTRLRVSIPLYDEVSEDE